MPPVPIPALGYVLPEDSPPSVRHNTTNAYHAALIHCCCHSCTSWAEEVFSFIKDNVSLGNGIQPEIYLSEKDVNSMTSASTKKWEMAISRSIIKLILFNYHGFKEDKTMLPLLVDFAMSQENKNQDLIDTVVPIYITEEVRRRFKEVHVICQKDGLAWNLDKSIKRQKLQALLLSKTSSMALNSRPKHTEAEGIRENEDKNKECDIKVEDKPVKESKSSRFHTQFNNHSFKGAGGCGVVFKADHYIARKTYAIKIVQLSDEKDENEKKKEVEVLCQLKHDNIVDYNDSWIESFNVAHWLEIEGNKAEEHGSKAVDNTIGKCLFIKMEYCDNGNLNDFLHTPRKDPSNNIKMFKQMVSAVEYIHGKNVSHHDIKTNNIFVTKDGDLKLGDFGLARVYAPATTTCSASTRNPQSYVRSNAKAGDIKGLGWLLHDLVADYRDKKNPDIEDEDMKNQDRRHLLEGNLKGVKFPRCVELKKAISKLVGSNAPPIEGVPRLLENIQLCKCIFCKEFKGSAETQVEDTDEISQEVPYPQETERYSSQDATAASAGEPVDSGSLTIDSQLSELDSSTDNNQTTIEPIFLETANGNGDLASVLNVCTSDKENRTTCTCRNKNATTVEVGVANNGADVRYVAEQSTSTSSTCCKLC